MATSEKQLSLKNQEKADTIDANPEDKKVQDAGGPESDWTTADYAKFSFDATVGVKPDTTILSKAKVKAEKADTIQESDDEDEDKDEITEVNFGGDDEALDEADDDDEKDAPMDVADDEEDVPMDDTESDSDGDLEISSDESGDDDGLDLELDDLTDGDTDLVDLGSEDADAAADMSDEDLVVANDETDASEIEDDDLAGDEDSDDEEKHDDDVEEGWAQGAGNSMREGDASDEDWNEDDEDMTEEREESDEDEEIEEAVAAEKMPKLKTVKEAKKAAKVAKMEKKPAKKMVKEGKLRLTFKMNEATKLFEGNTVLTEEDKRQSRALFESAVKTVAKQLGQQIHEAYSERYRHSVKLHEAKLAKQIDQYLSYVVEQWSKENKMQLRGQLRNKLAENFMASLKNVFVEHYIDVPKSKVNVVEALAKNVKTLKSRLKLAEAKSVELHTEMKEAVKRERQSLMKEHKSRLIAEAANAVVAVDRGAFVQRAESLRFSNTKSFKKDLIALRESYFGAKKSGERPMNVPDATPLFESKKKPSAVDVYTEALERMTKQS